MAIDGRRSRLIDRCVGVAAVVGLTSVAVLSWQWSRAGRPTQELEGAAASSDLALYLDELAVAGLNLVPELRHEGDILDDVLFDLEIELELIGDLLVERAPSGVDEREIDEAIDGLIDAVDSRTEGSYRLEEVMPPVAVLLRRAQVVLETIPPAMAGRLSAAREEMAGEMIRLAREIAGLDAPPQSTALRQVWQEVLDSDAARLVDPSALSAPTSAAPDFVDFDEVSHMLLDLDDAAYSEEASALNQGNSAPRALILSATSTILVLGLGLWRWKVAGARRRRVEDALRHDATHDGLTGLMGRNGLETGFDELRRRPANLMAVVYIDLDEFKQVNDRFGHHAGDEVLRQVADRLRSLVRGRDQAVRLGGDEFMVLLHDVSGLADAVGVSRRIVGALSVPYAVDESVIDVGASAGVALSEHVEDRLDDLMRDADSALYVAKSQAGEHVVAMSGAR